MQVIMKNIIIDLIVCPTCGKKLHVKSKQKIKDEIIEGNLICSKNHKFQIKRGIPRFVTNKGKDFVKLNPLFHQSGHSTINCIKTKNGMTLKKNGF